MSDSAKFLKGLQRPGDKELAKLYYAFRKDFVKWARKKYYPSDDEAAADGAKEPKAIAAYQRVLTILRKQSESAGENWPSGIKKLLEEVAHDMAVEQRLTEGGRNFPGLDFQLFDASAAAEEMEAPEGVVGERDGKLTEEQIRNIARYLDGKLEGDQLASFKVDLAYDQAVADEVARMRRKRLAGDQQAAAEFLRRLQHFETEWPYDTPKPKPAKPAQSGRKSSQPSRKTKEAIKKKKRSKTATVIFGTFFALLGGVLLLVLIGLGSAENEDDPTGLYKQNFTALQDYIEVREDIPLDLETGMNSYNHGDFGGAIQPLQSFVQAEPGDREARLYLGISQLANSDEETALRNFQEVANVSKPDALKFHAEWYKGMTYLRSGQEGKAKAIFKKLQFEMAPTADYRAQSRDILERMDR